jgi:hypothetical protein
MQKPCWGIFGFRNTDCSVLRSVPTTLRELPTNNIPLAERSRGFLPQGSQQQAQPKSIIPPSCRSFRLPFGSSQGDALNELDLVSDRNLFGSLF